MKVVVIFAFLILFAFAEGAHVACDFGTVELDVLEDAYQCYVQNSLNITTKEEAVIESASPSSGQTVKAFYAYRNTIHFFPRNLELFFPSLEGIIIYFCGLEEVKKDDLKPFPQLRLINFGFNRIRVIEQDLFQYNPNLEYVKFRHNKITHIDPNVFDHLTKLSWLWLFQFRNICFTGSVINNTTAVKSLIAELKTKCKDPQYTSNSTNTTTTTMLTTTPAVPLSNENNQMKLEKTEAELEDDVQTDNQTIDATTSGVTKHENIFLNYLFTFFTLFCTPKIIAEDRLYFLR